MGQETIDRLIINSPYEEPQQYWSYDQESRTFTLENGRRPAGYRVASQEAGGYDDPGYFIELELVQKIRKRVKDWREDDYPGVTGITRRLLDHWNDTSQRENREFFFCQLEAIETLIWLAEAPDSQKVGIEIPGDGGAFQRLCAKMATGTGKTVVMAMLIAWQILNKVTYPTDSRYSKYILAVTPGLTIKNRLQVLKPENTDNFYDEFNIVPIGLRSKLRQGNILVVNWRKLDWETEEDLNKKKTVDKRGAKSDEAYVREVLGEMASARNIIVINDEAHHAWRVSSSENQQAISKEEKKQATKWVGGLDRIHRSRGIRQCYDFSATPFELSGNQSTEEALFDWIVSDFGLNDSIESGLVKTPRIVVRDDGQYDEEYKSKLYHIYKDPEVKDDLNRKAEAHEPLPDLVTNAYYLLGKDWLETAKAWDEQGMETPPVMITVANRVETAARIKYAFDHNRIKIDELCNPKRTLHVDSQVIKEAEAREEVIGIGADVEELTEDSESLTKQQYGELLRRAVDTIGRKGEPGEQIQNVISVGMLTEGWDAKTVTHIMGLRAFSSQLLCEQIIGRGLRRTSYETTIDEETGKAYFEPEYVNIFGVPFSFLPHESTDESAPKPPTPKTRIEPVSDKQEYALQWPNIIRVEHTYKPRLELDIEAVEPLTLKAHETAMIAEMAPMVEGKPDVTQISEIDLRELGREYRFQRQVFEVTQSVYEQFETNWTGNREVLIAQLAKLVHQFIISEKLRVKPEVFNDDPLRKRILVTLNMNKIVHHIVHAITEQNAETIEPVFDHDMPIRSTHEVRPWYTSKPCHYTKKSHINYSVFDSRWEATEAFELDHNEQVEAWVKNDHLGFEIPYIHKGKVRKYRPDFIIRLKAGTYLVLETKGEESEQDKVKREYLDEWIRAINSHGGFGHWAAAVSYDPSDVADVIESVATNNAVTA